MATTLAVLMVLGIFIGIPAVIGLAIAGAYMAKAQKAQRAKQQVGAATRAKVHVA